MLFITQNLEPVPDVLRRNNSGHHGVKRKTAILLEKTKCLGVKPIELTKKSGN
jgi:hypothetical protein